MGDTTCFVAKAGDEAAASQDERYGPPSVSLNWQSERRPVPMARSRQQPSTAPRQRGQGVAGGADGVSPDRWSSSSSVTVEVVQRGAPRPAERRSTMTPSTARYGKPPSTRDSSAADTASSMEISSAVALSPGSPGKRAVNIDIEFTRPTAAGSSRGMLLRSISTNVEKIIGRLLAPPRSDSRSQLIRGPPGPPRGAYATPWQVPRGYVPIWRPEQPVWDPYARAWRVPRGHKRNHFAGPDAVGGALPTAGAHARFMPAPEEARPGVDATVDESGGAIPSIDEALMRETMEGVPGILEGMKDSLTDDVKAPQTAATVRRASGGESLKHETADGVPGILDRFEDSLADHMQAALIAAAVRRASSGETMEYETAEGVPGVLHRMGDSLADHMQAAHMVAPTGSDAPRQDIAAGIQDVLGRTEQSPRDEVTAEDVVVWLKEAPSRESLSRETVGGAPQVLGRMEDSLAAHVADVKALAGDKKKKAKLRKGEKVGAEDTEITSTGAKNKKKKKARKHTQEKDKTEMDETTVKSGRRKSGMGETASSLCTSTKKKQKRKSAPVEEKTEMDETAMKSGRRKFGKGEAASSHGTSTKKKHKRRKSAPEVEKTEMLETEMRSERRKSGTGEAASPLGTIAEKKQKRRKSAAEEDKTEQQETKLSTKRRKSVGTAEKQPRKMSLQTEEAPKKEREEQRDDDGTSPGVSEKKKKRKKKALEKKDTVKEPEAAVVEATNKKRREPEVGVVRKQMKGDELEAVAKDELEALPQLPAVEAKAMAPPNAEDEKIPDDDVPKRLTKEAQVILGEMGKALVEEVEAVRPLDLEKEAPGDVSLGRGTAGGLPRAADDKEPEKGVIAASAKMPGDMPHVEKPEATAPKKRSKRRKKPKAGDESRLDERTAVAATDVAEDDKLVESHIAPWKKSEGAEDKDAGKVTAATEMSQPAVKKVEETHEDQVKGRRKMSKKEPSHGAEKSDIVARSPEKKHKKVSKMATTETEKSTVDSGKESASKKTSKKAGGKKKKSKRKDDAEKSTLASMSEKHSVSHSASPEKSHKKKGKKKHKKKKKRPERTAKKTEVETGTIGQIALEHEQKRRTSAVEQKVDEHPAAGDKTAETASELPVPKFSIMKGSHDSRRKSKQHESALMESGAKSAVPDEKLLPALPSAHPAALSTVDSAATGEGPTAMPSSQDKEVELTAPLEVDLDTATAHQAAKLKKVLRAKQRKEPATDTAEETTFKWSTSTMPSHIREMFFSTYRWGISSPPLCEPTRSMKWGTSQMGRRESVILPTPSLVPSPPEPGRRASVVRICPQSISLKESRPPKPSDPKKKKKKKKKPKGKSVLAPASTLTSAPATPFVMSPSSGTTGVTSLGTSPTASSAATLAAATSSASQKATKRHPAGATVERSVPVTSSTTQVTSLPTKAHKSSKGKHKRKKHSKKTHAKGEKPDSKSKKKHGKEDEKAATAVPATTVEAVPVASPQIVPFIVEGPSLPMLQAASEVPPRRPSRPEAHKKAKTTKGAGTKLTEGLVTDVCPIAPVDGVGIATETAVEAAAGTAAAGTTEKPPHKDRKRKKSKGKKKGNEEEKTQER
ncbi:proteoglycan 4-like [Rhipicephalus sanguineus]|uniref:proteoglycan 4-like n=1 Tax=Rhipicephalus sanguineus TaxID=34632 RepID=UPI0018937297|nr:proteoglycan 4-like [Rhipicephalus sanguineus]